MHPIFGAILGRWQGSHPYMDQSAMVDEQRTFRGVSTSLSPTLELNHCGQRPEDPCFFCKGRGHSYLETLGSSYRTVYLKHPCQFCKGEG